jgi:predicted transcriptional regulator
MWLKAKEIDNLLSEIQMTRAEFAKEMGCSLRYLDQVCDGLDESHEELSRLIIAAFGAEAIRKIIDWRRTAA